MYNYINTEYRHIAIREGKIIIGGVGIWSRKPLNFAPIIVAKTTVNPIAVPTKTASEGIVESNSMYKESENTYEQ